MGDFYSEVHVEWNRHVGASWYELMEEIKFVLAVRAQISTQQAENNARQAEIGRLETGSLAREKQFSEREREVLV